MRSFISLLVGLVPLLAFAAPDLNDSKIVASVSWVSSG